MSEVQNRKHLIYELYCWINHIANDFVNLFINF